MGEVMSDSPHGYSRAVENFLKAVYSLQQHTDRVSTNALAEALELKAPSVTDMARRLAEGDLINYRKYYGVLLTEAGETIALRVIRRHRLIELYLVEELGYALHEVHEEAEHLEHAVSDRFVEALSEKLGHPQFDPHGDPIPSAEGVIIRRNLLPLSQLPLNVPAVVARLNAKSEEMLRYILDRQFQLMQKVEVVAKEPFEGPLTVTVNGTQQSIGHVVAASILVDTDRDTVATPSHDMPQDVKASQ